MTRRTDVFIPLEERTAIANAKDADLFLSIHVNSSRASHASGVETYYLSFAVDAHAEEVAARAALMANETGMRLLGVVENMSYLVGSGQELFGSGGGERLAEELGVPLLGRIPLDPVLRECGERGEPVTLGAPESEAASAIVSIAEAVAGSRT